MMPFNQLVSFVPDNMKGVATIVGVALGVIFAVIKAVKFVPQGQQAMRKRFGQVVRKRKDGTVKIYSPGWPPIFLIPYMYTIEYVSSLDRTVPTQEIEVSYGERLFKIKGSVLYRIEDIFRVRYAVDDFEDQIKSTTAAKFRDTLTTLWEETGGFIDILDKKKLQKTFKKLYSSDAERLGVKPISIDVIVNAETGESLIANALSGEVHPDPTISE